MNKSKLYKQLIIPISVVVVSLVGMSVNFSFAQEDLSTYVAQMGSKNRSEKKEAIEKLLTAGKKSVPFVMAALDDADVNKKATAIKLLGELKATEAVPKLIEQLNSQELDIVGQSAYALGKIGDSRAVDPLIALLETSDSEFIKETVIFGLGYLKDQKAVPHLQKLLKSTNQQIRISAAAALGLLGKKDGLDEALTGTHSENTNIMIAAVQALGVIGDTKAVARLEEMIKDQKMVWKNDVLLSLKQIEYANLPAGEKLTALKQYLYDKNTQIVRWAIDALVEIGSPEAISLLEEKARSKSDEESDRASLKLKKLGK